MMALSKAGLNMKVFQPWSSCEKIHGSGGEIGKKKENKYGQEI